MTNFPAMNDFENIVLVYYARKKEIFGLDSLSMRWYNSQILIPNYGNLILSRKLCLKSENIYEKIIIIITEIIKLSVNNKIFTNKMKIIIGIKVWNIAVYLKRENKCNNSLKFLSYSFPFIECIPNNDNISVSDVIRFICVLCLNLKWIAKRKQINHKNDQQLFFSVFQHFFHDGNKQTKDND